MITLLLQSGNALLQAQAASPSSKLEVTGFKMGDAFAFTPNPAMTTVQGNLVKTGTVSDIRYIPLHDESVLLQLIVEHNSPEIDIGNVLLEVNGQPFSLSYSSFYTRKLSSATSKTGIRFMLQLELGMEQINERFDFTNLSQNVAEFVEAEDEQELLAMFPPMLGHDQAMIQEHSKTLRVTPVLFIDNEYWGCPLAVAMDDDQFFIIDGGTNGDRYQYVDNVMALIADTGSGLEKLIMTNPDGSESVMKVVLPL